MCTARPRAQDRGLCARRVGLTCHSVGRSQFRSDLVVYKGPDLVLGDLDVWILIVGERVDKTKRTKPADREFSYATEVLSTCGERRTFRQGCPSIPTQRS